MSNVYQYEKLYSIDRKGNVYSKHFTEGRKLMKTTRNKDGYEVVGLTQDGKQRTHKMHRLLMLSYRYEEGCET